MQPIEIIVIIVAIGIVLGSIVLAILRKKKGKCICGCDGCPHANMCNNKGINK